MEILGYIASLAMGVVLGLMGGGGSILTVPIMVYLFGLTPTVATGYSLFIVGLTAAVGCAMYIRKGEINFKAGILFAAPSIIGVNVSRTFIIPILPNVIGSIAGFVVTKEILVMAIFAVLMIVASHSMIGRNKKRKPFETGAVARMILMLLQGFMVGMVAGFVGAGGGFLIIPALVLFIGLPMRIAIGTSLMIIALQSLMGFMSDLLRGVSVDWHLLVVVAVFAAVGIVIGSMLAYKVREQKLKVSFGWFVLAMGTAILIEQIHQISTK